MSLRILFQRLPKHLSSNTAFKLQTVPPASICVQAQLRCMSSQIIDPPDDTPPIPEYIDRGDNEPVEVRRARLLYQSRKRGMTENGLLLSTFAAIHLDKLSEEHLKLYDHLINRPSNDWEIYYWITGNKATPPEYDNTVMDLMKDHARNADRNVRLQQPDLYT